MLFTFLLRLIFFLISAEKSLMVLLSKESDFIPYFPKKKKMNGSGWTEVNHIYFPKMTFAMPLILLIRRKKKSFSSISGLELRGVGAQAAEGTILVFFFNVCRHSWGSVLCATFIVVQYYNYNSLKLSLSLFCWWKAAFYGFFADTNWFRIGFMIALLIYLWSTSAKSRSWATQVVLTRTEKTFATVD